MGSRSGSRALRLLNGVFAGLFFLGALVQLNDPDPLRWMLIYLAAGLACLLAAIGRGQWQIAAAVAVVALAWVATIVPGVLGRVGIGELFAEWEMKDVRVEEGREMYGLLLISAWMIVLTLTARRRRQPAN